jgi:hypothetical protein
MCCFTTAGNRFDKFEFQMFKIFAGNRFDNFEFFGCSKFWWE